MNLLARTNLQPRYEALTEALEMRRFWVNEELLTEFTKWTLLRSELRRAGLNF
jgi:hypothetical protein